MTFHVLLLLSQSMKLGCTLTLLHLLILSASATDTLLPGEWIPLYGDFPIKSLVSSNQMFELGFFTPGNSSYSYVGIWYHNISVQTVVWVANRDWPIYSVYNDQVMYLDSAQLTFTRDGNLMVVDDMGAFSVFTYGPGISNGTTATLLDTGNLVLRDARGRILWQSFDNPTDHFLPGMLLGWDTLEIFLQNRVLTSWKSSDDPSSGDYSFGADPNAINKQFITWQRQGETREWSTGLWDGSKFSNIPSQISLYFKYVSTGGVDYLSFVNPGGTDHSQRTRAVISENGQFSILIWVSKSQEWILLFSEPRGGCDVVNICGLNTVCSVINGNRSCDCVRGFQPGSLTNWRKGDRGDGCVRKTSLQCSTDVFLSLPHVKFPLDLEYERDANETAQCESVCLKNCNCTAYAYEGVCHFWDEDIATLQQLDDDGANLTAGTLYMRLAASESSSNLSSNSSASTVVSNNNNKKLKIGISLTVVFVAISCVLVGSFLWWRRQKGREKLSQEQSILLLGVEIAKELGQNGKRAPEFTLFDFSQISDATNGFSNENKLGEGGFGPVYKGILTEGQEIAVKRLSTRSGQGLEEFKNEILLIAKLQHSNLVRLLGCCIQKEEKILIYEYMQNKSLDFFIFDKERRSQLDWSRRRQIIEGIAQGIIYLHKHSRLRIIHRDLKASNVLLDAEMNPKISDFGMARIFNPNEAATNTIRVVGTYGYMSPEYVIEGIFSVKSDVFSFGVLLLEIVSGKRNTSFHQYKNALNLVGYAWELWLEANLSDLADPSLGDICPLNDITRCIHVALLCVQEKAIDRPTMTEVITMLSSETASLVVPKQPAFVTMRVPRETDLPRKTSSVNNVTITSINGR